MPNNITSQNVEARVMALRYRRAWELEFAKLDQAMKGRVMADKLNSDKTLHDPAMSAFIRRVVGLAESDVRI